jgi:Legionella pneumophila major outer membrane protein precursor
MKKKLASVLFLGLAALPCAVQAQVPNQGYQQGYGYQYQQPNQAPGYYNPQQMPRYAPMVPNYQGTPMYSPQPNPWYYAPVRQDTTYPPANPSTPPQAAPRVDVEPRQPDAPVQQVAKQPAQLPEVKSPDAARTDPAWSPPSPSLGAPVVRDGILPNPETPIPDIRPSLKGQDHRQNKLMVFGDFLYWNVHGADVPFAQAFDGIDPVFSVPRGAVGVVSPDFTSGFRAGAGVSLDGNVWVVGTFTYFRTDANAQIEAPDGQVLHNFLVFPNTTNSSVDSLTSRVDYNIRLYMGDIDAKFGLCNTSCASLNVIGGVRYAHLGQYLTNTFELAGSSTVDSSITFDGVGPRIGLEGEYRTKCGIYGYASGVVDLLFGRFNGSTEERNIFTGLVGQTSISANRMVPILELELGIGWRSCNGRIGFSGGYYVGTWFNTMTMTSLSNGITNTNFTTNGDNFRDNLTFNGFVGRFEFRY